MFIKERGPLSELTAQRFFYQLAQALELLDTNDIMHRDLKPQNILLSHDGSDAVIKLADFGLAKYSKSLNDLDDEEDDQA